MFRYKLRTLLILLAILPPLLAVGWVKYAAWRAEHERRKAVEAEQARQKAMQTWLQQAARGPTASDTDRLRYLVFKLRAHEKVSVNLKTNTLYLVLQKQIRDLEAKIAAAKIAAGEIQKAPSQGRER